MTEHSGRCGRGGVFRTRLDDAGKDPSRAGAWRFFEEVCRAALGTLVMNQRLAERETARAEAVRRWK